MAIAIKQHFDVFNYVKKSKEFGANEQLAEYQARQIEQALFNITREVKEEIKQDLHADDLVTKENLKQQLEILKLDIEKQMESVRTQISQASNKTILWVVGIMGTFGVFFLGILAKGFHWL